MWQALYSHEFNSIRIRKLYKKGEPSIWQIPMSTLGARRVSSNQFIAFIRNYMKIPEYIDIEFFYLRNGDRFPGEPSLILEADY